MKNKYLVISMIIVVMAVSAFAIGGIGFDPTEKGDCDLNGEKNISDLICLINHVKQQYQMDVNSDGVIDQLDVTMLTNILFNPPTVAPIDTKK